MDVSKLRIHGVTAFVALAALTVGAGTMRANTLLNATPTVTGTISCATLTGPGAAATISVKAAGTVASGSIITVTVAGTPITVGTTAGTLTSTGLVVTPVSQTINSATAVSFSVNAAPGCAGLTAGTFSNPIQFKTSENTPVVASANDASTTISSTLSATLTSALVAPAITVYCGKTGSNYLPSTTPVTVSVTSAANEGTPFTVDPTTVPAWLSLSSTSGGLASTTGVTFTATAVSPCDSLTAGTSATSSFNLLNPPANPQTVSVTIKVLNGSPLTAAPTSLSFSHTKGSGTVQTSSTLITSTVSGAYFTVNTITLPIWLTVNNTTGFAPASLSFSTTNVADTMPPGTYTTNVYLQVSGYGDYPIAMTLFVTNSAPKLTISSANPLPITWTLGSAYPTATITAISSDTPIPYTITTGGALAPIVAPTQLSGLAYSFGTEVGVTFNPTVFATAQPGTVLTGTVTFSWGSPATVTVVTINLTVASPGSTLTGLSPATLPTAVAGTTFQVVLTGSGFVGGSNSSLSTKVGIVPSGGGFVFDSNLSVNVVNPSNIILTITVPTGTGADPDSLLPFAPAGLNGVIGGSVTLGVCNGTCTAPTGTTQVLTIGGGPIVQGVTSSSSFTEVTAPTLPSLAPYDMISIFGINFCSSGGTGCGTTTLLSNSPQGATQQYPTYLSPDALPAPPAADTRRKVTVTFYPHGTTTGGAVAPLLFATNGQINAIVPGALTPTDEYDIVVTFGCASCTPSTAVNSPAFPVNIVASDPGIFTIGSDGQGSAAALDVNWNLIGATNPVGVRAGGSDSDTISLYVTGLGAPTSAGSDLSASNGCIAAVSGAGNYMSVLNTAEGTSLTNIDGAVIQDSLFLTGDLPPCLSVEPTVKIGGVAGTVTYAGFVGDTVAGLYQINVQLPPSTSTFYPNYPAMTNPISPIAPSTFSIVNPVQLPVQVTVGSGTPSQTGVTLWVAPRLEVEAPSVLSGTVGIPWTVASPNGQWATPGNCVVAHSTEGTAPFHYAVTSSIELPAGLSLDPIAGCITGIPAANTGGSYLVTVTATDSATVPVTGSVSFTISITADLYVTMTGNGTYSTPYGTLNATVSPVVTVTGGTAPYTLTLTTPATDVVPAGMTMNTHGQIGITALTPAGTYSISVSVQDANGLTGSINFTVVVNMTLTYSPDPPNTVASTPSTNAITTITAHGGSGTYTYTLDPSNTANALLLGINSATGAITVGTAADTTPTMPVIIDVVDSGAAPTGGTVAPMATITITVTISE